MSIKALIQVVATIATMIFLNGHLPDILKRVQMAKIHLVETSRGSTWGKAMIP